MEIDDDLERFPASIDDALLVPDPDEAPEAPAVRILPRTRSADSSHQATTLAHSTPLYFQCPACRSTLCVPVERLSPSAPAPCGHCGAVVIPPMLALEKEDTPNEAPQRTRYASGSLPSPK